MLPRALTALCILLTLAALAGRPAPATPVAADSSPPRLTPRGLSKAAVRAESGPGTYLVVLDDLPLARYGGGLSGLAATSPRAIGTGRLDTQSPAARAYLAYLDGRQAAALRAISAAIGRPVAPRHSYRYALNGVALSLDPAEAAVVANLPGVRLVQRDVPRPLATDSGPGLIGAAQADLRPALFSAELRGSGPARGRAVLTYNALSRQVGVQLAYQDLSGPPVAAWLLIARPGLPPGLALDLTPLAAPDGDLFAGELQLGAAPGLTLAATEDALLQGQASLVITTSNLPEGEITGTLLPARGEGVLAGVADTGINPFTPSFADPAPDGYTHANPRGPGAYLGVCDPAAASYRPDFPCNEKLVGAYSYPATAALPDPAGRPSPFDDDGHGSHTASTLGGNLVPATSVAGVNTGAVTGVAPHASLVVYDVCGTPEGSLCPLEASVAAIDQAAAHGVAVLNYSISGFAGDPWADADALAFLGALEAGVLASVAAGNGGPSPASIGAPANAPWVIAAGASSHGRTYTRALTDLSGGATLPPGELRGVGFGSTSLGPAPLVDAAQLPGSLSLSNPSCGPFAPHIDLNGAILVCRPFLTNSSVARYAARAGAGGLVIVWPPEAGPQPFVELLELPTVALDAATAAPLLAWLASGSGHRAAIGPTTRDTSAPRDTVAWFSARGPNELVPGTLKPDLVAPGLNILAASADHDPSNPDYTFLSGTSMAAPHAAGAAALLRQLHPDWTPMEIRSALMTTALPTLRRDQDEAAATPHDAGSGRIRVELAARAGLLLDESPAAFAAADPTLGGDPSTLNLASLSSALCLEQCVFTRTVRNALGAPATWQASAEGDTRLSLRIEPSRFTLAAGATQTITITAQVAPGAPTPEGSYLSGAVIFDEARGLAPRARLPVALNAPSAVLPAPPIITTASATGAYAPGAIRTRSTDTLTLRVLGPSLGSMRALRAAQDPTPLDPLDHGSGTASLALDLPADTPRAYLAIVESTAPDTDLFVFEDGAGGQADGAPQAEELICASAGRWSDERCDLPGTPGAARRLIVVVQIFEGSGRAEEEIGLLVNLVPGTSSGTITVIGPARARAEEPFTVELHWSLATNPDAAGRYLGVLELSNSADLAAAGDLGLLPFDIVYLARREYTPMVARE